MNTTVSTKRMTMSRSERIPICCISRWNGMPLKEADKVIYPVCALCKDHEQSGFVEGVKIGIRLAEEIG